MTELTDRYVATLRTIPVRQREDIEAELRASIEDAVEARVAVGDDEATAVKEILTGLGDPDRLVSGYTGRPGYLIGPDHFFVYRRPLAVLLITVVPIVMAVTAVGQVISGRDIADVFAQTIGVGIFDPEFLAALPDRVVSLDWVIIVVISAFDVIQAYLKAYQARR